MSLHEDEVSGLKKINIELVQKVQYWKMLAGQRENEKLNLMKEINELRLQLSRLRSNGRFQADNLEAVELACEKALSYLVVASGEIRRTVELTKAYMRHREELDNISTRLNTIGGTPQSVKTNKVHRVPHSMMGGQSIQPVVALTKLNTSIPRTTARSPDLNRSGTIRALPMHMLQDVLIPLSRIDKDLHVQNMETDNVNNADDRSEEDDDDDDDEVMEGSQRISDLNSARQMYAVEEESEPDKNEIVVPRSRTDNPSEGPSWMIDGDIEETSQDELESLGSGESAPPRRKHKRHHGSNTEHHSSADNTTNHRTMDPKEPRAKSRRFDKERYKLRHREGNVTHRQRHRMNSGEHSNTAERSDRQENEAERSNRQGNSVDLSMERHERHRQVSVRNRSAERNCDIDLWTDSRASNDPELQQDSGYSSTTLALRTGAAHLILRLLVLTSFFICASRSDHHGTVQKAHAEPRLTTYHTAQSDDVKCNAKSQCPESARGASSEY